MTLNDEKGENFNLISGGIFLNCGELLRSGFKDRNECPPQIVMSSSRMFRLRNITIPPLDISSYQEWL